MREFYVLALNRAGRPAEAIREASEIMANGGHSPIVWGALAQSHSARMGFAERIAQQLAESGGNPIRISKAQFEAHFPDAIYDTLTVGRRCDATWKTWPAIAFRC